MNKDNKKTQRAIFDHLYRPPVNYTHLYDRTQNLLSLGISDEPEESAFDAGSDVVGVNLLESK